MGTVKQDDKATGRSLWLDDRRLPPEGWEWVRTASEAILALSRGDPFEVVSLDHDLGLIDGETEQTGYFVLLWIEERVFLDPNFKVPEIRIHTANSSARIKMELAIKSIKRMSEK